MFKKEQRKNVFYWECEKRNHGKKKCIKKKKTSY